MISYLQTKEVGGTFLRKHVTTEINVKHDLGDATILIEAENSEDESTYEPEEDAGKYQNQAVNDTKILIKFDYHILYHMSYAVPYLCFNAFKSGNFF